MTPLAGFACGTRGEGRWLPQVTVRSAMPSLNDKGLKEQMGRLSGPVFQFEKERKGRLK